MKNRHMKSKRSRKLCCRCFCLEEERQVLWLGWLEMTFDLRETVRCGTFGQKRCTISASKQKPISKVAAINVTGYERVWKVKVFYTLLHSYAIPWSQWMRWKLFMFKIKLDNRELCKWGSWTANCSVNKFWMKHFTVFKTDMKALLAYSTKKL